MSALYILADMLYFKKVGWCFYAFEEKVIAFEKCELRKKE